MSVRSEIRLRKMSTTELATDTPLRGGRSSRKSVLSMLEHCGEFERIKFEEYIDTELYPLPAIAEDLYATAGIFAQHSDLLLLMWNTRRPYRSEWCTRLKFQVGGERM